MYGTIADLGGTIQEEIYQTWDEEGKKDSVGKVCELIDRLLGTPRPDGQTVRGIGIGAPGVTYYERGVVAWAPSLGWRDLPFKQILEDRYGLPVIVENDVNLAALGEYGFGAAKGSASLVCMAIGTGIGAGIVIDRQIYRGFHQTAGEIGYLPPDISYLNQNYEGFGALESIASGTGIAQRGNALLHKLGLPVPENGLSAEDVFQKARLGEAWARQVVDESVMYLAFAIAAISALIDPEVIILGGGVARSADVLIGPIQEKLAGVIPSPPRLIQSTLGFRATVLGAILMVLDETTQHVAIERLG
jgi:predicted NBD/HSP70 family sugar kinase